MSKKRHPDNHRGWLVLAVLLGVAAVAAGVALYVRSRPLAEEPVLFVHGFGNKGTLWLEKDYATVLRAEDGLAYHGNLTLVDGQVAHDFAGGRQQRVPAPCLTVSLARRGEGPIDESAAELAQFVDWVRGRYRVERVALVGFSLGGVICRGYLTTGDNGGKVSQLITVSSPHLGSEYAMLYRLNRRFGDLSKNTENDLVRHAVVEVHALLQQFARDNNVNLNAPALALLEPPAGGNYLDRLNRRPHPRTCRYTAIVTNKGLADASLNDLRTDIETVTRENLVDARGVAVLCDTARRLLGACRERGIDLGAPGDGFVSVESQEIANIAWFREHPDAARVDTWRVEATHGDHGFQRELIGLLIRRLADTPQDLQGEKP